ncbi:MAG: serine/threonine protein phosphatase, partial [Alphaproteobacteria bacterium]|nr:serine/threonine protein phosphatase [Alphaproteobacteria bacterium]
MHTLNVNDETKVILFGDLHGSYHTFFRNICRLHRYGVLDLNTFKINDPYKIIFLGDILDRGMYALDILNVIFKLMLNNNTEDDYKIIYNRGNHENYDQYLYDYMNGRNTSKTSANEFNTKLNLLFCILPSAIIINNQEKHKYWCSHGGFPNDFEITDDIFILIDDEQMAKDIRWSDFGYEDITNKLAFGPSPRDRLSGKMKTYTHKGTMDFLEKNDIDFIIRGHQDSYANSALCNNIGNFFNLAWPTYPEIPNIILYNDGSKYFGNRVLGPIARLNVDKDAYDEEIIKDVKLLPVLTISTNTDNGRDLNADSFALLRFDIQPDDIDKFDKNILSILHNIKDAL